jgi:hypothetical protein
MSVDYSKYIPAKLRDTDLNLKIIDIINNLTAEQMLEFNDILLKYKDPYNITDQAAREVISEFGFDYITEIVEALSSEELGTLVTYMSLISSLKGHRDGLELIFNLLDFAYELVEWWETDKDRRKGPEPDAPTLEVDEWKLSINIAESGNLENIFYTAPKLRAFVQNYVYPVLAYLELLFEYNMDNISITAGGAEFTDRDVFKVAHLHTVEYNIDTGSSNVDIDVNNPLFIDNLLNDKGYFIYTADNNIIKMD